MDPPSDSSPIIVISNRLPVTVRRTRQEVRVDRSSGGLVAALDPVLRRMGGTWVGWPGLRLQPGERDLLASDAYHIEPVPLTDREVRRYYHGFSNGTLWPLFHSFPERTHFDRRDWQTYDEVNARFAEVSAEVDPGGALIWVHDYQLLRTALHLRERRPEARIAFFNHIPFPPYDVFRILPWSREILLGLLSCDLVGFHIPGYVTNFLDCVDRLLGARVDRERGRVEQGERTVQVRAFPLGIDFDLHESLATEASTEAVRPGEKLILGVDRLDYTKGIPERIRAFARLLERYPEHRERVVLLQVAVPSRGQVAEYQALKREIDELVGQVNGRFATSVWSPIRYLYRSMSRERLAGLYRSADVALVTPLRDGMNLVAKEFVASQIDQPGVLILSRMAGAAETMHESLRVNPYNIDSVTDNLQRALTMDVEERADRLIALRRRERRNDLQRWLKDFLGAAREPVAPLQPAQATEFESWLGPFLGTHKLALFLDYDGTLTPLVDHPDEAKLSTEMYRVLAGCAARADTDVTIVSGRALDDVAAVVGVEGITYAGNHGLQIASPAHAPFEHTDVGYYHERARALAASLKRICMPGAWVEEKGASLTFHYRRVDPAQQGEAAARAHAVIADAGFQPRDAHCAVEGRPPIGWDKGHAVLHVLRTHYGPGWSEHVRVIYVGDDDTDEDAFRALSGLGFTFRVGGPSQPTVARRQLPNVETVFALLCWLEDRSQTLA